MTISSSISLPAKGTYSNDAKNYIKWLAMVCGETDAAFTNYGLLSAGSNTTLTFLPETKTIVLNANSAFVKGNYVKIYDPKDAANRWMSGFVTDYVSGTKTLTVEVDCVSGSGSASAWVIHPVAYMLTRSKSQSDIYLTGGAGHGTTNTMIRRFTTTVRSVGVSVTYVDSATLGASFTINDTGFYSITYIDGATTNNHFGLSINTTTPTTAVQTIAAGELIGRCNVTSGASKSMSCKALVFLNSGDVIRPHTNAAPNVTTADLVSFQIRRVL